MNKTKTDVDQTKIDVDQSQIDVDRSRVRPGRASRHQAARPPGRQAALTLKPTGAKPASVNANGKTTIPRSMVRAIVSAEMAKRGRKGGKTKTAARRKASQANLAIARQNRWAIKR